MRDKLIALRKQKGKELGIKLTQEKVASQLNISRSFYNMIETGDRNPSLHLAKKIAEYFATGVEEIFFHNGNDVKKQNDSKQKRDALKERNGKKQKEPKNREGKNRRGKK